MYLNGPYSKKKLSIEPKFKPEFIYLFWFGIIDGPFYKNFVGAPHHAGPITRVHAGPTHNKWAGQASLGLGTSRLEFLGRLFFGKITRASLDVYL